MIERAAMAIYEADGRWACGFDRLEPDWRDHYQDVARAAIEAMREPTDEMRARYAARTGLSLGVATWGHLIDAALGT